MTHSQSQLARCQPKEAISEAQLSGLIWYAVLTRPQKEGLAELLLRKQGFETLYLHYHTTIKHARRTRNVIRAYFPRYLFAGAADGLSVPQINRTIGVSTVVYCGDKPLDIPAAVIEELRSRGDRQGRVKMTPQAVGQHRRRFRKGEQVRIMDGPMAGLFAIVSLDNGRAVRVWLDMFGGKVEALFDPEGLKSGSPEGRFLRLPARQCRR